MIRLVFLFFFIFSISAFQLQAQNRTIDSLKLVLKKATHDTTRCNILYELSETEPDDKIWPKYNDQLKALCESNLKKYSVNNALHNFYLKHLVYSLNNFGVIYSRKGNVPKALEYYHKSLKIQEGINNKAGVIVSLNNIGNVYYNYYDYVKALDYYYKSLKIRKEINDNKGIGNSLNNIGCVYREQGKVTKALEYHSKSLKIREEINDNKGIGNSLNNIGLIYLDQDNLPKALEYFHKSLKINEELNNKSEVTITLNTIAFILLQQDSIVKGKGGAVDFAERSLKIAQELGYPENIKSASSTLRNIYSKIDNWQGAYEMQVLNEQMDDSLNNEANRKAFMQKDFQDEYELKLVADSLKKMEKYKVIYVQEQKEKIQGRALYGGMVLLLGFGGFMFTRFRKEQKQKGIIAKQKEVIAKKNESINQSIDYALHLQSNILPYYNITDLFSDSFLLYQPKDVVSGDFYWLEKKTNNVYFALADCTGHGVPGAFMSMLGTALLNEIFSKQETNNAAEVLNKLNTLIKQTFKQHQQTEKKINDGMDIAFCILNTQTLELQYAGANRPLWTINLDGFLETKADKKAIGGTTPMDYEFTNHAIQLQKGDSIYLTSDGYVDQFGGDKGKKMMTKVLKQKLEEINNLPMQEQQNQLRSFYNTWKGNKEQVDDVTIIGMKV